MPHTILLVDDSVTIRRVVELAFQDTDIRVDAVGSGAEAMDRLAASPPDLVLADVVLPNPSGYDLCRAVKNSERPVPVLLLRSAFEPFDERRAAVCGADGSVVKPFESERLVERVRALLDRVATVIARTDDKETFEEAEEALDEIVDARSASPGEGAAPETTVPDLPTAVPTKEPLADDQPGRAAAPTVVPTDAGIEDRTTVPVRIVGSAAPTAAVPADGPDPALVAAVASEVVRRLSDRVIREIAWEVVPDLAAVLIRQRLREIEREDPEDR